MNVISANAPAKVNLYLHIIGKRPDNYHLLDSLIAFADISDTIDVTAAPDITVTVKGEYAHLLSAHDNIVMKAALAMQKHFKIKTGAAIILHKDIPVGAGLGGGSADAAATIRLLLRLWKINAPQNDLLSIALSLGADVPACLQSIPLYLNGIGDITEPAPKLPKLHILLVNPSKPLLTKDVFTEHRKGFSKPAARPKDFLSRNDLTNFLERTRNDLQDTAITLMPEIATVLSELKANEECMIARMSGSGATCFGLFGKRMAMENFALQLSNNHPDWWVRSANIL